MPLSTGSIRDASVALTGASQQALGVEGARQFLLIHNPGTASVGVNLSGAAAAIGSGGTVTLAVGASLILAEYVPTNAINVIGTSGQPLTINVG